jgi:hypothetical protein
MTNTLNRQQRSHNRQARLAWLRAFPQFADLPSADEDVTERGRVALEDALRGLLAAGLYSHSYAKVDGRSARWGIRRLVSELRGRGIRTVMRYQS